MSDRPILQNLANNKELLEATKEIILEQFNEVPFAEGATDELLGQIARARYVGRQKVEEAFSKILAYQTKEKVEEKDNPAY